MSDNTETAGEIEAKVETKVETWKDDDRVTETPTHFDIEIYRWAESDKQVIRDLEANPENAPPSRLKLRRLVTVTDIMALDEYDCTAQFGGKVALACVLSGNDQGSRVRFEMMKRMSYQDWLIVVQAIDDLLEGKG